jgi:thiamine-phosphate pyrophosphorylase
MKLIVISSPDFIPEEAEIINSLFREGLECMHIRKPRGTKKDFAKLLSEIRPVFLDKIAIHQHHELATEFGMNRLHFTESQRRTTAENQLGELNKTGFTLSTSIHDLDEMENLSTYFSYSFFGPVFDSISKPRYTSALRSDFFIQTELKKIPLIGLGGIGELNLHKVRNMNLDGAAVLGVLWREPHQALEVFRILSAAVNQ